MIRALTRTSLIGALALIIALAGAAPTATAAAAGGARLQRDFIIPDNTLIEGTLETRLDAKYVAPGQQFTMRVTSPREFRDATVYGHVADAKRSGRVRGRSEMTLAFDRVRMPDGRTYEFAGDVEAVRTPDGEDFGVDESTIESHSQGDRTVRRSTLGAVAGTLIGALAGGGSGAAQGALIGGGIGAGSVLVQGRRSLDLQPGTRVTVRASAPR